MKRMKKTSLAWIATISAALLAFAGCDFSHYVPEEFGTWENNYIYRGNVRSKTTGEDWQYLVNEVSAESGNYSVLSCEDYAILGDDIYLCLRLDDKATAESENLSSIIQYDVKDKTQTTIIVDSISVSGDWGGQSGVWTYEPYSIERAFEDRLIVYGRRMFKVDGADFQSDSVYYTIDLNGNFISAEVFSPNEYAKVSDDYFTTVKTDENGVTSLYYITWGMTEEEYVCALEGITKREFVDKGDVKGFLFTKEYKDESDKAPVDCMKLSFFDITNNEEVELYDGEKYGFTWNGLPSYEYFVTSERKQITYTAKNDFFESAKEVSQEVWQNCVLYKVEYAKSGVTVNKLYTFEEDKSIGLLGVKEGKLHVGVTWYENARGCSGGGSKNATYALDISSKVFEKVSAREALNYSDFNAYYARMNGAKCGNYTYYLDKQAYGISLNDYQNYAYMLQRYDGEKTETMQIWSTSSVQPEEAKFCQQMWKYNGGDINDFIVRNY